MKVAIVYNRDTQNVINLFGVPNREKVAMRTIKRISDALKAAKHQVQLIEGDKDLVERLAHFMPRVVKGERPGLVFNLSYGIQGQARYTHVPSILEMVGIPYVGSGPLAHGLALDKVMAKMIFRQHGLPTPDFAVMESWDDQLPKLAYPLVVKPRNEAVSFGIKIVRTDKQLREAVRVVQETFRQPILLEHFVKGREVNVALIGNNPPETFAPVEIVLTPKNPPIYTYEDKTHRSGRKVTLCCPAEMSSKLTEQAQQLAMQAFKALGCCDCARVDIRIDQKSKLQILEVNSLPSLGTDSSYVTAAAQMGLDFDALVNRLVEVASARYFGTPHPMKLGLKETEQGQAILSYVTERRDRIERRLRDWTHIHSRTMDPLGLQDAVKKLTASLTEIGLKPAEDFSDQRCVSTWETARGFERGTLLVGHLDVPLNPEVPTQEFRRDPEWLYGEGIGLSRAPLVMLEFALRALRSLRRLRRLPIGVLYYTDEGSDALQSAELIAAASANARHVLILRPGNIGSKIVTQRRGQRKYRLRVESAPTRPGKASKKPDALQWLCERIGDITGLSSRQERIAIAAYDLKTTAFPMLLPHAATANILLSYGEVCAAERVERELQEMLRQKQGVRSELEMISDRPPMKARAANRKLARALVDVAERWEIPLDQESSLWPSVAGLVPTSARVVCGVGPVAKDLYTPHEAVERISLVQRTLLLAEFLAGA